MAQPQKGNSSIEERPWIAAQIGESKVGKTTDMLFTLNDGGYYFGRPGSFRPSLRLLGWIPDPDQMNDAQDLRSMHEALKRRFGDGLKPHPKTGLVPRGVGIDDLSLAADATKAVLEKTLSGWDLWGALGNLLVDVIRFCNMMGLNTVISGHPRPPEKGEKGGFKLPTKELIKLIPKYCDLVVLVDEDVMREPHPYSYKCGPKGAPGWITGDRNAVCPPSAPLNLAEILRLADRTSGVPFRLPRLRAMESPTWSPWGSAEDVVVRFSEKILTATDPVMEDKVLSGVGRRLIEQKVPPAQIAWILRDLRDRVELDRANENRLLNDFGLNLFGAS